MISLTSSEWARYKDDWAKFRRPGTKVVVHKHIFTYDKKKDKVEVVGMYVLSEGRRWEKLS